MDDRYVGLIDETQRCTLDTLLRKCIGRPCSVASVYSSSVLKDIIVYRTYSTVRIAGPMTSTASELHCQCATGLTRVSRP